jgi:hypothetical protein
MFDAVSALTDAEPVQPEVVKVLSVPTRVFDEESVEVTR